MAEQPQAPGEAGAAGSPGAENEHGAPSLGGVVEDMVARLSATDADRRVVHAQSCRARVHACCSMLPEETACLLY